MGTSRRITPQSASTPAHPLADAVEVLRNLLDENEHLRQENDDLRASAEMWARMYDEHLRRATDALALERSRAPKPAVQPD